MAASVAVVIVVFAWVLPRFASYGSAWTAVRAMSTLTVGLLALATVANMLTYAGPWMASLPGMGLRRSMELSMSTTALANVVPLGGAVAAGAGYGMLREWGWSRQEATRGTLLTGVATQLLNVVFPIIALAVLAVSGEPSTIYGRLLPLALLGFLLLVIPILLTLASDRTAHWVGEGWRRFSAPVLRAAGRGPQPADGPAFVRFRCQSLALLRARWLAILWTNAANLLSNWLVLAVALAGVGVSPSQVGLREGFAAWALSRLLGTVPLTPGGLGIVELGLTSALTGFGGAEARVVAAVLVYRALTLLPAILAGGVAAFTWRRQHPSAGPATVAQGGQAASAQGDTAGS